MFTMLEYNKLNRLAKFIFDYQWLAHLMFRLRWFSIDKDIKC